VTATFGPYGTEQETYDSPLARAVQAAEPGRGVSADLNLAHLGAAIEQAGIRLGGYDLRILNWLSRYEPSTVQVVIGLISRAHAAGLAEAQQLDALTDEDRCQVCGESLREIQRGTLGHIPGESCAPTEAGEQRG
jgi:hypothetical protein